MEGEKNYSSSVYRDERGEYRIGTTKSTVFTERDCGDHFEVTPIAIANSNNPQIVFLQRGREPDFLKSVKPVFSIPSIVLKIPKDLPQDSTERMKVLKQIEREALLKAVYHILQANNETVISPEDVMTFLQSLKSEEKVKNLCGELNKSL